MLHLAGSQSHDTGEELRGLKIFLFLSLFLQGRLAVGRVPQRNRRFQPWLNVLFLFFVFRTRIKILNLKKTIQEVLHEQPVHQHSSLGSSPKALLRPLSPALDEYKRCSASIFAPLNACRRNDHPIKLSQGHPGSACRYTPPYGRASDSCVCLPQSLGFPEELPWDDESYSQAVNHVANCPGTSQERESASNAAAHTVVFLDQPVMLPKLDLHLSPSSSSSSFDRCDATLASPPPLPIPLALDTAARPTEPAGRNQDEQEALVLVMVSGEGADIPTLSKTGAYDAAKTESASQALSSRHTGSAVDLVDGGKVLVSAPGSHDALETVWNTRADSPPAVLPEVIFNAIQGGGGGGTNPRPPPSPSSSSASSSISAPLSAASSPLLEDRFSYVVLCVCVCVCMRARARAQLRW
jgi:hypothetical protein